MTGLDKIVPALIADARLIERLRSTCRAINLVRVSIEDVLEVDDFVAPELAAALASLVELSEAVQRALSASVMRSQIRIERLGRETGGDDRPRGYDRD